MRRLENLFKQLPPEMRAVFENLIEFFVEKKISLSKVPFVLSNSNFNLSTGGIQVTQKAMSTAEARTDLVRLYRRETRRVPRGLKTISKREFARAYNLGKYPKIYAILGKTSWQTLERWRREINETGDPIVLAPRWGEHRRGKSKISEKEKQILLLCKSKCPNEPLRAVIRKAMKIMQNEGITNNCSIQTYRRFLKNQ